MAQISSIVQAVREFTGGSDEFEIEAVSVRGLLAACDLRFPGLGTYVREHMAIAIDGVLYQEALGESLRLNSEVVFIPKITGG
jgi:molybdopterin converting factor small subunit